MSNSYLQITAITQDVILPKLEDQIFDDVVFLKYIIGERAKQYVGGTQLQVPVIKAVSSQGGSFGRGDRLDTAAENNRDKFIFDWKSNHQPVVAFGIDIAASAGQAKMVDHMTASAETAMMDMMDNMSQQVFGLGTGNGSKDLLGLAAIVDDGTAAATYGGITRASNTWANAGYTDTIGVIQIDDLQTSTRGATSGARRPDLHVTAEAIRDSIEDLFTPTTQNTVQATRGNSLNTKATEGLKLEFGASELSYRGAPIIADEDCTSDKLYTLNTKFLNFHNLKHQMEGMKPTERMGIAMTPVQRPDDQDGVVSHLIVYGEFASSMPRSSYQLDGIS